MSEEKVVKLRVTLDTSTLAASSSDGKAAVSSIGDAGAAAAARMTAAVTEAQGKIDQLGRAGGDAASKLGASQAQISQAYDQSGSAIDRFVESQADATARIREMVQASLAQIEATKNAGEAQKTLAERSGMTADQAARLNEQLLTQANSADRMRERADALSAAEAKRAGAAAASTRSTKDEGDALNKLLGQIDPVIAKLGQLDAMEQQLKSFKASGAIGADDYAVFSQKLGQLREQATGAGEGMHQLTLNSAGAKREIGVLIGELARGNFAALEGSTITLANRTGLLSLAFSGVGLSIGALFAVIGGGLAIYAAAERENDAFNRGLIATGNYAGTSGGQLRDQASAIGNATGEYGKAAEALTKLVSSGKLSGDALGDAARGAVALSEVTGKSIEQSIAEFEKLADDPVKAVVKLNDSYHFLTLAVYDQIKALQDQGNQEAATSLAVKTAADALDQRRQQIVDNAGAIERGWRKVTTAIGEAIDNLKQVGRADVQGRLQSAYADLASIDDQRQEVYGGGVKGFLDNLNPNAGANLEAERAAKLALIKTLEDQVKAQDKADVDASKQTHLRDNAVAAAVAIDAATLSLDKQAKKLHDIQELNANYAKLFANPDRANDPRLQGVSQTPDGGFSGGDYDKLLGAINEKYSDHGKAARDAAKEDREFEAALKAQASAMEKLEKATESANAQTSPLDAAFAHFVDTLRANNAEAAKAIEQSEKLGASGLSLATIQEKLAAANANAASNYREETAAINARTKLSTGNAALLVQLQQQRDKLAGLSAAQVTYNKGVEQANKDAALAIAQGHAQADVAADLAVRMDALAKIRDNEPVVSLVDQFGGESEFDQLVENIDRLGDALSAALDPTKTAGMQRAFEVLNRQMEQRNLSLVSDGVSSLQKFAKEGTAAYTALGIAQDILAYKAAITAIATQGSGDPYTAFARIAAMIALMASIGIRVAGGGDNGPSAQSAEVRQASQGTGSVLGDSEAKSESIAHAIDITADATTQLVGLNRGMLTALQALQNALGAAGNQLARGAGDVQFAGATDGFNIGDPFGKDPLGGAIGSFLFGGGQKVIDQGIVIAGGALTDMLNKIVVGAYQTIETDGGLFGSDKTNDQLVDISDGFGKQFQLVIQSIADTVRAGATALGLLPADVEAAIASYQVEAIRISLKGLSAEDQQKELEAVFSKLFDGLAGSVVPFIGQFQKVGEGLGETLVRVATEVQVTQEAFKQLGLSVDESDPEKFAQISDALVNAAGGLDAFISGMQSFVSKFAPDAQQFQVQSEALTSAFSQVGLTVPTTRDAMFELMQSLDATTDAGRAQIATLLRLTDTADAYYTALEKRAKAASDYVGFVADLGQQAGKIGGFITARLQIAQWEQETIKQANTLARAAGLQGASEQDLALIHEVAAQKIVDALRAIKDESRDIVDRLNGVDGSASSASTAVRGFGDAMTSAAEAAQAAAELLLGDKSPFNDQQKLQYAIDAYQRGLVNKDQVLEIGRRLYATSQQYTDLFNLLQRTSGGIRQASQGGGGSVGATGSTETRSADEIAADRHRDAEQLAQNIASIALAQGQSYEDVAADLKYGLGSLANDLGLSQDQLTDYLDNLKKQQSAVGDAIDGNTDRLIAALYDIAGLPPPVQSDPVAGGPISPDELPRRPRSTAPLPRDRDLDDPNVDPRRPRSFVIPDSDENGRARAMAADQASAKQNSTDFAAMRALLSDLLTATRDGVTATRGVAPAVGIALRDTTGATAVLAQRALASDQAALQRLRANGRDVEA